MNDQVNEGGCQCGAIRFRTTGDPVRTIACHCKTCKQRTGSAYGIGVYFQDDQVEFLSGDLQPFEFHSEESGRWLRNEFCAKCGCTVTWTLELRPGVRGVAGGNFDNPDWFDIDAHIWTASARSDAVYPDSVTVHEQALS